MMKVRFFTSILFLKDKKMKEFWLIWDDNNVLDFCFYFGKCWNILGNSEDYCVYEEVLMSPGLVTTADKSGAAILIMVKKIMFSIATSVFFLYVIIRIAVKLN